MLQVDQSWLSRLDIAMLNDHFVLQKDIIIERAYTKESALHDDCDDNKRESYLDALLQDAAQAQFGFDELPSLYNDVLWAKGAFYRHTVYAPLFRQVLLHSKDRAQQLNHLLIFHKRHWLRSQPYYANLSDDPLEHRLTRIQRIKDYGVFDFGDSEQHKQWQTGYLAFEYQALLLALLSRQLGKQAKYWRGVPCDEYEFVHIDSQRYQRALRLCITFGDDMRVESRPQEQQTLWIALPGSADKDDIVQFDIYLNRYLQGYESAEVLATKHLAMQQEKKQTSPTLQTTDKSGH